MAMTAASELPVPVSRSAASFAGIGEYRFDQPPGNGRHQLFVVVDTLHPIAIAHHLAAEPVGADDHNVSSCHAGSLSGFSALGESAGTAVPCPWPGGVSRGGGGT